jgi:GDPmannose 4,6-dehydratase
MMKKAPITSITGQDGAYLARFLLSKGYEVHGIKRHTSLLNTTRIDNIYEDPHSLGRRLVLHYGDMTDSSSLIHIVEKVRPDEIYNFAAQSHVKVSFEEPEYTANSDALGVLRLLEAIRILGLEKTTRFYRPPPLSYMVWCRRHLRRRPRPSILGRPMPSQNCMATGS